MKGKRNVLTQRLLIVKVGARRLQNAKFYATLLIIVMLGIFSLSQAISSLMNSVVISSTGQISPTKVTARSGSPADIQAAVNTVYAAGGGTVYVPAGTWTFNPSPDGVICYPGVSIIGAVENQTILKETVESNNAMIVVGSASLPTPSPSKPSRISNLWFQGCVLYHSEGDSNPESMALQIVRIADFRVDHCNFDNFTNFAIMTDDSSSGTGQYISRGVIDHCTFDNPYKTLVYNDTFSTLWGYGIIVAGPSFSSVDNTTWGGTNAYGNYGGHENCIDYSGPYNYGGGVTIIEDCHFKRCRHAIAGGMTSGGYYVARYNYFEQDEWYGYIDLHGGCFGFEAYNNTIVGGLDPDGLPNVQAEAFELRGGSALIYNNTVINCPTIVTLTNEAAPLICDTWIWSNTLINYATLIRNNDPTNCIQNVTYFLYGPKPGYTPYPYPFPFVDGGQLQPAWDAISQNSTTPNSNCQLSVFWRAMNNPYYGLTNTLSYYYLESNKTGTMQNSTIIAFTNGLSQWTNFTIALPSSGVVPWRVHANNTAGQWSTFSWQYVAVTGGA